MRQLSDVIFLASILIGVLVEIAKYAKWSLAIRRKTIRRIPGFQVVMTPRPVQDVLQLARNDPSDSPRHQEFPRLAQYDPRNPFHELTTSPTGQDSSISRILAYNRSVPVSRSAPPASRPQPVTFATPAPLSLRGFAPYS